MEKYLLIAILLEQLYEINKIQKYTKHKKD